MECTFFLYILEIQKAVMIDCLKEEILIIFIYLLSHIPVAMHYK